MAEFVFHHVEPHEVVICGSGSPRRLRVEPIVGAFRELAQCNGTDFFQHACVVFEWLVAEILSRGGTEVECGAPALHFFDIEVASFEGDQLVGELDGGDVSQQCADAVALGILQVIELRLGESANCMERRGASVVHHRDQTRDLRREAGQVLYEIRIHCDLSIPLSAGQASEIMSL